MRLGIASIAVLAIGCAKNSSGLTSAEAQSAGQALGAEIEDGAKGFGTVNAGAAATPSCVTLSGDVADPDGDSIPNSATLTFDCTTSSLGITDALTGTLEVKDTQPNQLAWAFDGTASLHDAITAGGASLVTDRTGSITATQGTAAGPFGLARSLMVTTVLTGSNNNKVTVDETADWTVTYAPSVTWMPGSIAVAGTLAAAGTWDVGIVGGGSASAKLATPTPLSLDPACDSRVTAGTVTADYAAGAHMDTLTVTWSGCGASTVTLTTR